MEIEPQQPWWRPDGAEPGADPGAHPGADPAGTTTWLLSVRVQPGASRTGAAGPTGPDGAELKVRLASPPVDGRANDELVRWLAKELGVPRSAVELVRGQASRSKLLRVDTSQRRR
ncbi:hypothetical protein L615_001700000470 [Nocardioides sp. J9]|uniref:DUF167 domain-containing protein n=1 Tax=unclassified Nocardioides TaxID=2615069 RepID=UPI0004B34470|nr:MULTISPECIES: DUF167 domain-containing protein [unclassified Nocardioides]TWH01642.1 hypothetical protein L615_001700000470 [Nocardioides sp. J9]